MIEITKDLFIGDINDFYRNSQDKSMAFVHATQTVHYKLMGWDRQNNKPSKNHPNYIKLMSGNRFSLNWVDGGAHLYNWTGVDTFIEILNFIEKCISEKKVLIHCDQGQSRSPTVGLLYLAFRTRVISDNSFEDAYQKFIEIYPNYAPSGIAEYVKEHWTMFR